MSITNGQEHVDPKHATEVLLGTIKWTTDDKGYCRCPGEHKHSSKSGNRECIVYLNGAPTIFCLHQSCVEDVQSANMELRQAIGSGRLPENAKKHELQQHAREQQKRIQLEQRSRSSLKQILEKHSWPTEAIVKNSPKKPQTQPQDQWKDIVSLFKENDAVWIGERYDSGSEENKAHFKTVSEWLATTKVVGTLTCPATFKTGSFSRSNTSVLHRRFLVVESDILSKEQVGAVFRWLRDEVGLTLRAVVDTAGKSLHGWFDFPKKTVLEQLEIILPQLGCDPGLFRESQPCRIPGALRDGRYQTLLYLDHAAYSAVAKTPSQCLPLPQLYFSDGAQCYWRETSNHTWQKINEKALEVELKAQGFSSDDEPGALLSEAAQAKREIQIKQGVAYTGRLAGYSTGVYEMFGRRILVTEAPTIITPKVGEWHTIRKLIEGLLKHDEVDQTPYFYGWMKLSYAALGSGNFGQAQALAIAGPKDSGKSRLQNLITPMLGGRVAKPYDYMSGRSNFNSQMFAAEHLMIEDEPASTRIDARKTLGSMIKMVTVNEAQSCHTKHQEDITLTPFWRLSITMNEEPEDLRVLPEFVDGVGDKTILLKAKHTPMPMPTNTPDEKKVFWSTVLSEVPAFLAFLQEWQIPDDLKESRFGVATYHHPELLERVAELQPEHRLLALIDTCKGLPENEWQGTALTLESILTDEAWSLHKQARNLLNYQNTCGSLLGKLASSHPARIIKVGVSNGYTKWRISLPHHQVNGNN